MTKIEAILKSREMTQGDLVRLIEKNTGFKIGRDRISMICTGRLKNYTIETAVMIAQALEVSVDSIIDIKYVKKNNKPAYYLLFSNIMSIIAKNKKFSKL